MTENGQSNLIRKLEQSVRAFYICIGVIMQIQLTKKY